MRPAEPDDAWRPDAHLGEGYAVTELALPADPSGPCTAALVHREGAPADAVPVLVVHGWSDYVFDRELLEALAALGADVWSLDLRRHGRALCAEQTPTLMDDLDLCDDEIGAALERIGAGRPPVLLAHSMGGLVAARYAQRRPGALRGLVLNSPWLEMHGGPLVRRLLAPVIALLGRALGRWPLIPRGATHYARSTHRSFGGSYDYDLELKPAGGHPLPAATLAAVVDAQRRLALAPPLAVPTLVLCSDRTALGVRFRPAMRRADTVLDVRALRGAARRLGSQARIAVVPGARHDVFLSDADARARALRELRAWWAQEIIPRPTMGLGQADAATCGGEESGGPMGPHSAKDGQSAGPVSLREHAEQLRRAADRFSLLRLRVARSIAEVTESDDPASRAVGEQIRAQWSAEEYAELGRIAQGLRASARRLLDIALAQERAGGKRMGGYQGAGFLGRGEQARERVHEIVDLGGSRRGASIGGFPLAPESGRPAPETAAFMPHASHALGAPTPDYEED